MDTKVPDPPMAAPPRGSGFFYSFLPFWLSLLLVTILFGWDYHRRHAPMALIKASYSIDGVPYEGELVVMVDGERRRIDESVTIGNRKIALATPDSEVRTFEQFVWYGPIELGQVDFRRLRGVLEVSSNPDAERFVIRGPNGSFTNANGVFPEVPQGDYELEATYGEILKKQGVRVLGLRTNTVRVLPLLGSLDLDSDPTGADFELISREGTITRRGTTPSLIPYLPTGQYRLSVKRDTFERQTNLFIRAMMTNQLLIRFVHAKVEIESTPSDSEVVWDGVSRGVTPMRVENVLPGRHRIEVRKAGFDPMLLEIKVEEGEVAKRQLSLRNTKYERAMEEGQRALERREFGTAIRSLEEALEADPVSQLAKKLLPQARKSLFREEALVALKKGDLDAASGALGKAQNEVGEDEEISRLQREIIRGKTDRERQTADAIRRKEMEDLAVRRQQAAEAFEQSIRDESQAASFATVLRRTKKTVAEVREACLKISKANPGFKGIERTSSDSRQLHFKFGGLVPLLGLGNYARFHAMEIVPGETEIRFKLFNFVSGNGAPAASPNPQLQDGFIGALRASLDGDLRE